MARNLIRVSRYRVVKERVAGRKYDAERRDLRSPRRAWERVARVPWSYRGATEIIQMSIVLSRILLQIVVGGVRDHKGLWSAKRRGSGWRFEEWGTLLAGNLGGECRLG